MSLATAMHGYGVRILSSVILIAQSDTRNEECVIGWLKFGVATF